MTEVVQLHDIPRSIVSDGNKVFLSTFWSELFCLQGTVLNRSTAYHPQTDGQTEVVNQCTEAYLCCFTSDNPRQWKKWLAWAEYWYNTSFHSAAQTTPFCILYWRDPPALVRYSAGTTTVSSVEQQLASRDGMLDELKQHLVRAQERMKREADKHRWHVQFVVGDMVYLKLCPYRQRTLATRRNEKLAPHFYILYEVVARVGIGAYKLRLPFPSFIELLVPLSPPIGFHPSCPPITSF